MTKTVDLNDCPTVWFAMLERSLRNEDYEAAAEAKAQLLRLGVAVSFKSSPMQKEAVHAE